ncbi:MAG: hypothetical protein VXW65_02905 [Pseudomonadota bacterium]|nr:hypothetical protein [Pseudomonadota bacterium]
MMNDRNSPISKEVMLELVQLDNGDLVLRPTEGEGEALVSIQFSDGVQEALGDQLHGVGQQMIQAALHMIMERQAARWHAQVLDEEPVRFS